MAEQRTGPPPPPAGSDGVPLPLRPLVWLLAVLWLPLRAGARHGVRLLEGYERGADAAGRAVLRGLRWVGRLLVRVLGPLGRAVRALLTPVWRLLLRACDRIGLWLLLFLLRPVGRLVRRMLDRFRPLVARLRRLASALVARLEPLLQLLLRVTDAMDLAGTRFAARLHRAWAPVARAARRLGGRGTADG